MLARQSAYDAFHARFTSDSPAGSVGDVEDGLPMSARKNRYSAVSASEDMDMDKEGLLSQPMVKQREFNPYETYDTPSLSPPLKSGSRGTEKFELCAAPPPRNPRVSVLDSSRLGVDEEAEDRRPSVSSEVTLTPGVETSGGGKDDVALTPSSATDGRVRTPSPLPPGAMLMMMRPGSQSSRGPSYE